MAHLSHNERPSEKRKRTKRKLARTQGKEKWRTLAHTGDQVLNGEATIVPSGLQDEGDAAKDFKLGSSMPSNTPKWLF
jgi:hypothetical protein